MYISSVGNTSGLFATASLPWEMRTSLASGTGETAWTHAVSPAATSGSYR